MYDSLVYDVADSTKTEPAYPPYATKLAWLLGMFLKDIGHSGTTEEILTSLNDKLQKVCILYIKLYIFYIWWIKKWLCP